MPNRIARKLKEHESGSAWSWTIEDGNLRYRNAERKVRVIINESDTIDYDNWEELLWQDEEESDREGEYESESESEDEDESESEDDTKKQRERPCECERPECTVVGGTCDWQIAEYEKQVQEDAKQKN